jgi:protein SCO1
MTRLWARSAVIVVLVFLGITAWKIRAPGGDAFGSCREGQVVGGAGAIGGPFTLVDQTGRTVTDADVIKKPTLVYFGYTFCPDVCPLDMARTAEAVDILEERGVDVTPVFISVDPRRDTPEVLADFTASLHPRMIGLTGTSEQVQAAAQAYKTYYLVDHSTYTYLMLPGAGFADFFQRDVTADEMADRVACFVEHA